MSHNRSFDIGWREVALYDVIMRLELFVFFSSFSLAFADLGILSEVTKFLHFAFAWHPSFIQSSIKSFHFFFGSTPSFTKDTSLALCLGLRGTFFSELSYLPGSHPRISSDVLPPFEIANTIHCHFNTIDHIDHRVVLN